MKCSRIGVAVEILVTAVLVSGCTAADGVAPFNDSITESALTSDLYVLSHDSMAGRLVGSPELDRTSDWIRSRFESLGLEPAGDNGTYDQHFDLAWFSLGSGNRLTVSGAGGARQPGNGWTPTNVSATGSASGAVVFAGFGIVEPRLDFDDYQGVDVRGKVVLVLEREPGVANSDSPFDGVVSAEASRNWRKVLSAQERGAAAVLFVRDVQNRPDTDDWDRAHRAAWPDQPRRIERYTLGAWVERIEIPVAQVSVELAEALLVGSGQTLLELAGAAESASGGLGVIELPGARTSLTVAVTRHVTPGRNVLAMIEGSDPELARTARSCSTGQMMMARERSESWRSPKRTHGPRRTACDRGAASCSPYGTPRNEGYSGRGTTQYALFSRSRVRQQTSTWT